MKIAVCSPSYKRADNVRTLKYLPYCRIYVAYEEYEDYKANYPDFDIVQCAKGVQGNVSRVRNYILRQELEKNGADVCVIIDDDLTALERYYYADGWGYNKHRLTADEFLQFVEKYTIMAQDAGVKLWGVNCNPDYMVYRYSTPFSFLCFVGGPFQAFLKGNDCYYDESLPLKEDFDMTLQQLNRNRRVLRVNSHHYICEQSTIKGGCASYRNIEKEREQFELLRRKWGSRIVKQDMTNKGKSSKTKVIDYNPIIKPPIKGV